MLIKDMDDHVERAGFWSPPERNREQILRDLTAAVQSPVWDSLRRLLGKHQASLKTIELGCGMGKLSMLLALMGHDATFLDSNPEALNQIKRFLDTEGVAHRTRLGDLNTLPQELLGQFDLSLSVGTIEHFVGTPARLGAMRAHYESLKPGGRTLIAVPNYFGFFYRPVFGLRRALGYWSKEVPEVPYSPRELARIGRQVGFRQIQVRGLAPLADDYRDWVAPNLESLARKIFGFAAQAKPQGELWDLPKLRTRAGQFPDPNKQLPKHYLSAGIVLTGQRPA